MTSKTQEKIQEKEELQAKLNAMEDKVLINFGMATLEEITILSDRLTRIKFVLRHRLLERNAKAFAHPAIECKGKYKPSTFDYNKLNVLKELLDEEVLEYMYTPEKQEMVKVSESWDMRKVNGLKELGDEFIKLIDDATVKGELTDITFKRRIKK
tara:strand:+ start:1093 stop:1557 length:465 start_codon:yes stop_codon:yes gene_type:complete